MPTDADKGKLSAWERWEMASFDAASAIPQPEAAAPPEPAVQLPTEQEVEHIRQQAEQEGHQKGYQEGHAAGQAQARSEGERLAALAMQFDQALTEFDEQVAEDMLRLALEVARQVVRQAIVVKPERVIEVIREALAQMPQLHAVIHLHPEDAALARSYLGDQLTHAGHRIHEDPRQERGGCVIEAGGSKLDASVATRWKRVAGSLGADAEWLEMEDSPP